MPDCTNSIATAYPCLFCSTGCALCAAVRQREQERAAARRIRDEARSDSNNHDPYLTATDACPACGRLPGDGWQPRCAFCPDDPCGPRPCVRCHDRPIRTCFSLCRRCYDETTAGERRAMARRPYRHTPAGYDCDEALDFGADELCVERGEICLRLPKRDLDNLLNGYLLGLEPRLAAVAPAPLPEMSTEVAPGPEKESVLRERYRLRQSLHHPDDAGVDVAMIERAVKGLRAEIALRHGRDICDGAGRKVRPVRGIEWIPAKRLRERTEIDTDADTDADTDVTATTTSAAGKWRARPWWRYKRYNIGYFRQREDAINAVRRWREIAESRDEDGKRLGPLVAKERVIRELKRRRVA